MGSTADSTSSQKAADGVWLLATQKLIQQTLNNGPTLANRQLGVSQLGVKSEKELQGVT